MNSAPKKTSLRIVLAGGGTGGHIYPLLAVTDALKNIAQKKDISLQLYYLGPHGDYDELLKTHGLTLRRIASAKIRRYSILRSIVDVPRFALSLLQAIIQLFRIMPDAIFSKGGPGAFPVVFAGWIYRIPSLIHESDAVPGVANRLSSIFAYRIAVGFEHGLQSFRPEKTAWVGNPVRPGLIEGKPDQKIAKESLGFKGLEPLVVILGGSQGSQRLNEFVLTNLQEFLTLSQVLHQTGKRNYEETAKLAQIALREIPPVISSDHRYQASAFFDDNLKSVLAAADVIVGRAGAGSVTEIAAFGKPAILIPLEESANDHQRENAFEFAKSGGAVVIEENNLLPTVFFEQLKLILSPEQLQKMRVASAAFFKPGAAELIAEELLALGTKD